MGTAPQHRTAPAAGRGALASRVTEVRRTFQGSSEGPSSPRQGHPPSRASPGACGLWAGDRFLGPGTGCSGWPVPQRVYASHPDTSPTGPPGGAKESAAERPGRAFRPGRQPVTLAPVAWEGGGHLVPTAKEEGKAGGSRRWHCLEPVVSLRTCAWIRAGPSPALTWA